MANVTEMDAPPQKAPSQRKTARSNAPKSPDETPVQRLDPRLPKIGDPNAGSNWEYIESISDEQWKHLTCYLYRTGPAVDRQAAGKEIGIDKLGQRFDMQDIKKRHGSGRYKFILSYAPPSGGQWIRVRQFYETIMDLDYPPRVAMGDWLDNPANQDWLWAKPYLIAQESERQKQVAAQMQADNPAQDPLEQLTGVMTLAEKLKGDGGFNAAVLKILMENQDPGKRLAELKSLLELAGGNQRGQSSESMMIDFMRDEMKAMRQELAAARQPPAQDTSLQGMFLPILQKAVDNLVGGGSAGSVRKETAAVITETLGEVMTKTIEQGSAYLPAILDTIKHGKDRDLQIAQLAAATNRNPARPWEYQGPVAGPVATAAPQPAPTAATPAPAPAPQTAPPVTAAQPTQGPMTPQVFFAKYHTVLQRQFPAIMHSFTNENGWYLQDILIQKEGEVFFEAFRKDATLELLMQLVGANEQLRGVFQPEPKVREFFTQLLSDPPPDDEEDETQPGEEEV